LASRDRRPPPRAALAIAGLDPSGGAGVLADAVAMAKEGVHPLGVVTAITTQTAKGVRAVDPVSPAVLRRQIAALLQDQPVHAAKTGLLPSAAHVSAVAAALPEDVPLVVDPVIASSGGFRFLDAAGVRRLRATLIPRATLLTPNLPEAALLTGARVRTLAERRKAAEALRRLGARAVLVKGGHGAGDDLVDVLLDAEGFLELRGPRIGDGAHGTGCALASAIAAHLALGERLRDAVRAARERVRARMAAARRFGRGRPVLGA